LLTVLSDWRQRSEFRDPDDWLFASPVKLGRLPISYTCYKTALQSAAKAVGITNLASHTFRHTYRSWLDTVGTTPTVQQKLMRHSDIRTTMNLYGDVITFAEQRAEAKIAGLALKSDSKLIPTFASA
jgi:integrase